MRGERWRDGSWGEVVRVPGGGDVHVLDEGGLFGAEKGSGYGMDDLGYLLSLMIVYGGLRDVGVRLGEVVLVASATGSFGGAAVHVALALGARVTAMGRNAGVLEELVEGGRKGYPQGMVTGLVMSGEFEGDLEGIRKAARALGAREGAVDVYFDMSPLNASKSPHIKAGIAALGAGGRMSLMGGAAGNVGFSCYQTMVKELRPQGRWMFTPEKVDEVTRLVETGN